VASQLKLRITWVRSAIGCNGRQRATVRALGLHRLHESVYHDDNPSLRGMLHAVRHLVQVDESSAEEAAVAAQPKAAAPKPVVVRTALETAADVKPARGKAAAQARPAVDVPSAKGPARRRSRAAAKEPAATVDKLEGPPAAKAKAARAETARTAAAAETPQPAAAAEDTTSAVASSPVKTAAKATPETAAVEASPAKPAAEAAATEPASSQAGDTPAEKPKRTRKKAEAESEPAEEQS